MKSRKSSNSTVCLTEMIVLSIDTEMTRDSMWVKYFRYGSDNRSGLTRWQILQFTIHVLDTQPENQIRYRNRTCLKYRFQAIVIDEELARLMDARGGMTAVSGISAPFHPPSSPAWTIPKLTDTSVRKQPDPCSSTPHRSSLDKWRLSIDRP